MSTDGAGGGKTAARSGNLRQRVVSALVLVVLALAATWAGGLAFRLFSAAIAGAIFYEWSAMTRRPQDAMHHAALAVLLGLFLVAMVLDQPAVWLLGGLAVAVVLAGAHAAVAGHGPWPVAGLAYAGLSGLALALLRGGDAAGLAAIVLLFAIVWATDILAFFVGRAVGGPKLAPSISPGKTWSGAAGGTVAGIAAGIAAGWAGGFVPGLAVLAVLALALSVVAQAGDLFESAIKRRFSVKDSGSLIPGHGGVMDRVDGLVAAAVVLWLLGALTAGLDMPARAFFAD